MSARDGQRLARAIGAITADFVRKRDAKRLNNQDRGAERVEQVQMKLTGTATGSILWTDEFDLLFDTLFYTTTGNTQGQLERPHFSVGVEMKSAIPVAVHAVVTKWLLTDALDVEGCKLRLGAFGAEGVVYNTRVHLTFQGYGTPYDDSDANT